MSENRLVIAIDGPAGAGKSTVAKLLALKMGLRYLDTGAMYRALALKASLMSPDPSDPEAAYRLLEGTTIGFGDGASQQVLLDGMDVSIEIRTPEIGELASSLSAHPPIRRAMVQRQQALVAEGGAILEGRDATTVIAPDADLKIYMTASLEERARRRKIDFERIGHGSDFESVREQIENRDHRDITRAESPLRVAPDAHVIETAGQTIEQVADSIMRLVPQK